MGTMAWYLLPECESILSAGDELLENQRAQQGTYWTLWHSSISDDLNPTCIYSDKRVRGAAQCSVSDEPQGSGRSEKFAGCARAASSDCSTRSLEEQSEGRAPLELQFSERSDDIFLSQFSDEEMRKMDAPFQALDMFPDSMHRLLSYENMLSGVLTGSQSQEAKLDQNGIDTMDTCGFPLFSHDVQSDLRSSDGSLAANVKPNSSKIPEESCKNKSGVSTVKRSRSIADTEGSPNLEAAVLEGLEEVVFQLTKRARICFRDAFYRLAESSKAQCTTSNGAIAGSSGQGLGQSVGSDSRISTSECTERETNAIDRTVANLAFKLPCSAPQLHGNSCIDDSEAEMQSMSSWITEA